MLENEKINEVEKPQLNIDAVSGSQKCPNCEKEHSNDEWNGYCSKMCWWGFPVDCH